MAWLELERNGQSSMHIMDGCGWQIPHEFTSEVKATQKPEAQQPGISAETNAQIRYSKKHTTNQASRI